MIYLMEQDGSLSQGETARKLLLLGLKQEYGMEKLPEMARMEYGKPYFPEFPEIRFNYSHSKKGILCGISGAEIGVDIEKIIPVKGNFVRRVCHEKEQELLQAAADEESRERLLTRMWTAKESYLKCTGTGIRVNLNSLDFSACIQGGIFRGEYRISFLEEQNYVAAVCEQEAETAPPLLWRKVSFEEL